MTPAVALLWQLWRERAREYGRPAPTSLAGACKFGALLAQALYGGRIRANRHHAWVELDDGRLIDLTEAAGVPAGVAATEPDPEFESRPEFAASLATCRARVERLLANR